MGRFARGTKVLARSVGVLRQEPSLFLLPVASTATVLAVLCLPLWAALGVDVLTVDALTDAFTQRTDPLRYALLFPALFVGTAVATFFNAALAHCAYRLLAGEETSLRDGLDAAWAVRRRIVAYSLVTATIGVVLQLLEDAIPGGGRLTALVLELGWGLLTFFVVPVMVLDDTPSLREMFEESGRTFADTWGESVTATVGLGMAVLAVALVPLFVVVGVGLQVAGIWGMVVGTALVLVVVGTVSSALGTVARTMLYVYARDGETAGLDGLHPPTLLE
ncbi:DUF6159 family protein [Halomarina oriensis]|uniref:Glycerophosphoryl diester phosphodiesterase membrane domain-containing protein n=1 Tax=Halomarina oriensis TaxID=671145 RepID=A0A6B0GS22_9EURY|nr:DUF6159 family protein [Halomarina oriensis]MWG34875.1 hypothetical protein [Halomarina oriensis]